MRTSKQLFNDLVNLTADEWNKKMSTELGVSVEHLRAHLVVKETLTRSEDRLNITVMKAKVSNEFKKETNSMGESFLVTPKLSKYVLRMRDGDEIIAHSIACTGKFIIGMDFRDSELSGSYFCDCVFFNCDFSKSQMDTTVFNGCVINNCFFHGVDLSTSYIIRSSILDSVFNDSTLDNSTIIDTMFIGVQGVMCKMSDTRISGSGFVESFFIGSQMPGSFWVMTSSIMTEFRDSDMSESSFLDCIFTSSDFRGCSFKDSNFSCVTVSRNKGDAKMNELFEESIQLRSQAEFEFKARHEQRSMDDRMEDPDLDDSYA